MLEGKNIFKFSERLKRAEQDPRWQAIKLYTLKQMILAELSSDDVVERNYLNTCNTLEACKKFAQDCGIYISDDELRQQAVLNFVQVSDGILNL